jgi:hypothetical protein
VKEWKWATAYILGYRLEYGFETFTKDCEEDESRNQRKLMERLANQIDRPNVI